MFTKRTINDYFNIIKANRKAYLDTQMVVHLGIPGTENKKELIDQYLLCIRHFHTLKQSDLDDDIRDSTLQENAERGAFSALIGMVLVGLFFAAEQNTPSADLFGLKTAAQGGFATAIGASCSVLIYSAWDKSDEKPAHADMKACEEEMKKAGFTDERYNAIAADLVKLFHFRECLLLGLVDKKKANMREAFATQYYLPSNGQLFNDKDFNLAIEVYFLEQLNELFQQAFKKIHEVHAKEIHDEAKGGEFTVWFKRHFESTESRQQFTQEMQVHFIKTCIEFLTEQVNQPGFLGQYLYIVDFFSGLVTASLAVAICAVTTLFIPVFALVSIAIAAAFLGTVSAHLTISLTDLYYKRSLENRQTIADVIECVTMEQKRLSILLKSVPITSQKDLSELKKYDDNDKSSFLQILSGKSPKQIALGSARGWIREFAARYNESKVVEIDLSDRIKTLIDNSEDQTLLLQKELLAYMSSTARTKPLLPQLAAFIKDTTAYLKHPENAEFIRVFESVQKIKEQVLEITGAIPLSLTTKLPENLITFYTAAIAEGGLAGLMSDLTQVRQLAAVTATNTPANAQHPYQLFLDTAFEIQLKLNADPNTAFIFQGDGLYRSMLGLPCNYTKRIEDLIDGSNVLDYLKHSFNFLCTLNHYDTNVDWHGAFQNSPAFVLYRTLLVKQLAHLVDSNNARVDSLVKEVIKQFVHSTLNYNPDVAFNDILNQALLIKPKPQGKTIMDKLGNPRLISELSFIADAIRVDMAYIMSPLSPEKLITLEASHFLMSNNDKLIFSYNTHGEFIPEPSINFYNKICDTIHITTKFLDTLNTKNILEHTGTIKLYLQVISNEINQIKLQISTLKPLLGPLSDTSLDDVIQKLDLFKQTSHLPDPSPIRDALSITPTQNPTAKPTTASRMSMSFFSSLPKMNPIKLPRLSISGLTPAS